MGSFFSDSGLRPSASESDHPALARDPPPAGSVPDEHKAEVHPLCFHKVFGHRSRIPVAVIISSRHADSVRWFRGCKFGTAVLVGRGASPWLFPSAYFPQPGLGIQVFHEAIHEIIRLILDVPTHFAVDHIVVGCDANCQLAYHGSLDGLVGLHTTTETNWIRALAFLELPLQFRLKAANTFGAPALGFPWSVSPAWTHQHYGPSRSCSQIDYVLSPSSLPSSSSILYSLDCATDHKPVTCTVNAPLPGPAWIHRKSVKGSMPCTEADAQSFRLHLNYRGGANTARIQHVLMDAVAATPAIT